MNDLKTARPTIPTALTRVAAPHVPALTAGTAAKTRATAFNTILEAAGSDAEQQRTQAQRIAARQQEQRAHARALAMRADARTDALQDREAASEMERTRERLALDARRDAGRAIDARGDAGPTASTASTSDPSALDPSMLLAWHLQQGRAPDETGASTGGQRRNGGDDGRPTTDAQHERRGDAAVDRAAKRSPNGAWNMAGDAAQRSDGSSAARARRSPAESAGTDATASGRRVGGMDGSERSALNRRGDATTGQASGSMTDDVQGTGRGLATAGGTDAHDRHLHDMASRSSGQGDAAATTSAAAMASTAASGATASTLALANGAAGGTGDRGAVKGVAAMRPGQDTARIGMQAIADDAMAGPTATGLDRGRTSDGRDRSDTSADAPLNAALDAARDLSLPGTVTPPDATTFTAAIASALASDGADAAKSAGALPGAFAASTLPSPDAAGQTTARTIEMAARLGTPGFSPELAGTLKSLLIDGVSRASLELNPRFLGSMRIGIAMDDGRVSLDVRCESEHARDAVEASLDALRTSLASDGWHLVASHVRTDGQPVGTATHDGRSAAMHGATFAATSEAPHEPRGADTRPPTDLAPGTGTGAGTGAGSEAGTGAHPGAGTGGAATRDGHSGPSGPSSDRTAGDRGATRARSAAQPAAGDAIATPASARSLDLYA